MSSSFISILKLELVCVSVVKLTVVSPARARVSAGPRIERTATLGLEE